jgi:predicted nucleic acid-binding protein
MATLIDTNILVYAARADGDRDRQEAATRALQRYHADGALAVQILAEFASVLLRKGRPLTDVQEDVASLRQSWRVVAPNVDTVPLALSAVALHRMSFWDAMLWAIAKQHSLSSILTEDGPTGTTVGGVQYLSPFYISAP